MNANNTKFIRRRNEDGIALILTLAILVIATILVVGFVASMRTERQAAASIANNMNAALIAQAAIDHATSILDRNIPQPVPPGRGNCKSDELDHQSGSSYDGPRD